MSGSAPGDWLTEEFEQAERDWQSLPDLAKPIRVPPPYPQAEIIRELRENSWSIEGIARIYGITPAAVRMFLGEKI